MNRTGRILIPAIFTAALTGLLLFTASARARSAGSTLPPLTVSILKVGKADAIILTEKDHVMVIDCGEEDDGQEVVDFLKNKGIFEVEVLIITHFDKDHVGGADTLLESLPVQTVLLPAYEGSGTEYLDFLTALDRTGIEPVRLSEEELFLFGSSVVRIDPPASYELTQNVSDADNDFSLITTVTHGNNRLCFMGDAEKQRIRGWIAGEAASECIFLKVPYHGVYNEALSELLETVRPKYAAVCSSAKNPADAKTLELLKAYGTDVLQTKDGDLTVISDGTSLSMHQKVRH